MKDINAWSIAQARLLRAGCFDQLDVEHLAEKIEAVGQRERRELADSTAARLTELLLRAFQPARRCAAVAKTITALRNKIRDALDESPSLMAQFEEPRWLDMVWVGAIAHAARETGLDGFPAECPWAIHEVSNEDGWPCR